MLNKNQTLQEGRFCILQKVNTNNADISYEAFDKDQNSNVLIKEIYSGRNQTNEDSYNEVSNQRFSNKADVIINLNHQSLLRVQNYFTEEDRHYLVMEKLKGQTLGELLRTKKNPFSLSDITSWAYQMLDAVIYLHSQVNQILHRDIKPDTTLLDADGNIKLFIHSVVQNSDLKKKTVSEDEQFDSTNLAFSPLEQVWEYLDLASRNVIVNNFDQESQAILERPVDIRGDLYSVGATLYYLATAKMPFDALSRLIDMMDGNDDPLKTPNELNPNIPKAVSDVIMGALEIKRENRYSSAAIMKQILRAAAAKKSENKIRSTKIQEPISKLNEQHTEKIYPVAITLENTENKWEENLEIPNLQTQLPSGLKNKIEKPVETPKVGVKKKPLEDTPGASSENISAKAEQVPITKPWVFAKPKSADKIQLEEPPKVGIEEEQKQQIELIKEQLKEAEKKRIAAEKLIAKAERLLNAQESAQSNGVKVSASTVPEQDIHAEFVEAKVVLDKSEEFPMLELETNSPVSDNLEVEEKTDFYSLDAENESPTKTKDEFYKEVVDSVIEEEAIQDSVDETVPVESEFYQQAVDQKAPVESEFYQQAVDQKAPVESEFYQQADDSTIEPPPFLDVKKKIIPENNEEFDDNFALPEDAYEEDDEAFVKKFVVENIEDAPDDLFIPPKQKQSSDMKITAGAIVLLLLCGAAWGIWDFNNSLKVQSDQVIKTTNVDPPIETSNKNILVDPTAETDVELTDTESENSGNDSDVPEDSAEITDIEPSAELKPDTYSPPTAIPPEKPVYKPRVRTRRVVRPKQVKPIEPKATQAPKQAKPKKKAVTLDDLLNDN